MFMGFFGEQTKELRIDRSGFDLFSNYNFKNMKFVIPSSSFACLSIFQNSSNLPTRRERASVTMIILSLERICTLQTTQSRSSSYTAENAQINRQLNLTTFLDKFLITRVHFEEIQGKFSCCRSITHQCIKLGVCVRDFSIYGMWVLFATFSVFSNSYWLDSHNKTCFTLVNLYETSAKTRLEIGGPLI